MRKNIVAAILLVALSIPAWSQPTLADVDTSEARVSIAGNDVLLFRDLRFSGTRYIAFVARGDDGVWRITNVEAQDMQELPSSVRLDDATVTPVSPGELEISGVVVDGVAYRGLIGFADTDVADVLFEAVPRAVEAVDAEGPAESDEPVAVPSVVAVADSSRFEEIAADIRDEVGVLAGAAESGAGRIAAIEREIAQIRADLATLAAGQSSLLSAQQSIVDRQQSMLDRQQSIAAGQDDASRTQREILDGQASLRTAIEAVERGSGQSVTVVPAETPLPEGLMTLAEARIFPVARSIDLTEATVDRGNWTITSARAVQTDPDEFFSKLSIDITQTAKAHLYSMSVHNPDAGWVGVGAHIFVRGVERRKGYGHGSSLLVWLTRDPDNIGTDATYLELYRSDNDIDMERVLQAELIDDSAKALDLEILFDPNANVITVGVDGDERLRYLVPFSLRPGVEIALRSLGRAQFENLEVRTAR